MRRCIYFDSYIHVMHKLSIKMIGKYGYLYTKIYTHKHVVNQKVLV